MMMRLMVLSPQAIPERNETGAALLLFFLSRATNGQYKDGIHQHFKKIPADMYYERSLNGGNHIPLLSCIKIGEGKG